MRSRSRYPPPLPWLLEGNDFVTALRCGLVWFGGVAVDLEGAVRESGVEGWAVGVEAVSRRERASASGRYEGLLFVGRQLSSPVYLFDLIHYAERAERCCVGTWSLCPISAIDPFTELYADETKYESRSDPDPRTFIGIARMSWLHGHYSIVSAIRIVT